MVDANYGIDQATQHPGKLRPFGFGAGSNGAFVRWRPGGLAIGPANVSTPQADPCPTSIVPALASPGRPA